MHHLDNSMAVATCFDKDIFAHKSTMKVKLKILERANFYFFVLYLLVFELCP